MPAERLRICLTSWAPFLGGAEVAAERLAIGLRSDGHEVLVVVGKSGELHERLLGAGVPCEVSPILLTDKRHWLRYRRARNRLRSILREFRADVVHSNDLPSHQMTADAARSLLVPRICHHRFPFSGKAIDWMLKYGAERHLYVSSALRSDLTNESARLAAEPGSVVHDGLAMPPLPNEADRVSARKELGLPLDKVVVLFAGQVIEAKGVADLLRAWALLQEDVRKRSELIIVGDDLQQGGRYRLEMERFAQSVGCRAHFAGFRKDVHRWLTGSDFAVVPSHVEPLGNATLEAMSLGRPVVGSSVGGIPEMISHERTGLLIPSRDAAALAQALCRLITDKALRDRLGYAARERSEQDFSLKAHVRSINAEYHEAMTNFLARSGP